MYETYRFYRYPEKVGQLLCKKKHGFFMQNGGETYQQIHVLQLSSKSRSIFGEKHCSFSQNGVNCTKNKFYKYPEKVGQLLCKKNIGCSCKMGVKCIKKYMFYRYPVKVGQFLW